MLPELSGEPFSVLWLPELRAWRGRLRSGGGLGTEVHAAGFLRRRQIVLDEELARNPGELTRILIHEVFHFVWLRLGNTWRTDWSALLAHELESGVPGELGYSSELRKERLSRLDAASSSRRWSEYCCESFCDTAAWLFADLAGHDEFTLTRNAQTRRRMWFDELLRHQSGAFRI